MKKESEQEGEVLMSRAKFCGQKHPDPNLRFVLLVMEFSDNRHDRVIIDMNLLDHALANKLRERAAAGLFECQLTDAEIDDVESAEVFEGFMLRLSLSG